MDYRSALLAVLALGAAVPAAAQTAATGDAAASAPVFHLVRSPAAASIGVSGAYKLTIDMTVNPQLPTGTPVYLTVFLIAEDSSHSNSVSLSGTATVKAGKASATLTAPFRWLVASRKDTVVSIELSANGFNQPKNSPIDYSDGTNVSLTEALPPEGATKPITIKTSL